MSKSSKINARVLYVRMQKEMIPCGLCGSEDLAEGWNRDRYGMGLLTALCKKCGFLFTNPRPTQQAMNQFYKENYREFYTGNPNPASEYRDALVVLKRQWLYDRVKQALEKCKTQAPMILDVGCGSGVFLNVLRKNIPQSRLYGIEPFESYARCAREKNQAQVYGGDVDSFANEHQELKNSFHLISLYHVLEHLYHPVEKLLSLREFLAPKGLLLVQVPNALSPHWQTTTEMCHIAHIQHFSLMTLSQAFHLSGFRVLKSFASKHPGNARAMTLLGEKVDTLAPKNEMTPLKPHEWQSLLRALSANSYKTKKLKVSRGRFVKPKNRFLKLKDYYDEFGALSSIQKITKSIKRLVARSKAFVRNLFLQAYVKFITPFLKAHRRSTARPEFQRILQNQKVLILGSGPSAAELQTIPNDVKILTCNAGLRLFASKNINRKVDLFLCRRKAMLEDYIDIEDLLAQIKTDVFVMDDLDYVKKNEKLNGAYSQLVCDHQKDNFYLKQLIKPYAVDDIKADDVVWTSAGVRLLQYALYFGAKEIYLIGIDLSHSGYFWGEKFKYRLTGSRIRHKHPIDHNFLKVVSKKYAHVYSLSKESSITKYLPYKNPWLSDPSKEHAVTLSETTEK